MCWFVVHLPRGINRGVLGRCGDPGNGDQARTEGTRLRLSSAKVVVLQRMGSKPGQ